MTTEIDSMDEQINAPPTSAGLGLVMGGGGARAAYQVGFLKCLAERYPELWPPIITGVSAGAINAAHLAAYQGTFLEAVDELVRLWSNLTVADVMRVDPWSLTRNGVVWAFRLITGSAGSGVRARGLVDTKPLHQFLSDALHGQNGEIPGIQENLDSGRLRAIALSTSSYTTGQSVTWVQGCGIQQWERPTRISHNTTLTVPHVMASAALPLIFPAVELEGNYYGDGGIRLSAPLSPALHLGANKVLAISTRYSGTVEEASTPDVVGYPPPAQVAGALLNAVFLDLLDQDALRLDRLNKLITRLPENERDGLRSVKLLTLRPSQDLGRLANKFEPRLPRGLRFLTRGLGTKQTESPDFISLILFQPDYLQCLIETGIADAEARADELVEFIETP